MPTFASAIACIDGRVLPRLIEWARWRFGVDAIDVVTEPGADGYVPELIDELLRRLAPSLGPHGSHDLVLAAHEDCLGNPVDEATHRAQLAAGAAALSETLGPGVQVVAVYVHLDGQVDVLDDATD